MVNIVDEQVEAIRAQIGDGRAICALSGGVDSAVAAAIVQRAIGDRLTCVYVDHGMMRLGETEQVERDFEAAFDSLDVVDASDQFLGALEGVVDPEEKRKIIGREFIRVFEAAEARVFGDAGPRVTTAYLVQGTLYPDVVESGGGAGTSNIKSHHNVGGLPDDLKFELVEPLRTLFKDEVRAGRRAARPAAGHGAGASRSPAPASASASSARSPASGSTSCARPTRSPARSSPRRASTATSGSSRWSCWPTCARSASRATAAPTATPSCCARSPPRTR